MSSWITGTFHLHRETHGLVQLQPLLGCELSGHRNCEFHPINILDVLQKRSRDVFCFSGQKSFPCPIEKRNFTFQIVQRYMRHVCSLLRLRCVRNDKRIKRTSEENNFSNVIEIAAVEVTRSTDRGEVPLASSILFSGSGSESRVALQMRASDGESSAISVMASVAMGMSTTASQRSEMCKPGKAEGEGAKTAEVGGLCERAGLQTAAGAAASPGSVKKSKISWNIGPGDYINLRKQVNMRTTLSSEVDGEM
jgi:hypothetical protein